MKNSMRIVAALLFGIVMAALAVTPATATTTGVENCPTGFVCVYSATGSAANPDLIPEGQSRTYPGGLAMAAIANNTQINYCVLGNPNFGLGPKTSVERLQTINTVAAAAGAYCLM